MLQGRQVRAWTVTLAPAPEHLPVSNVLSFTMVGKATAVSRDSEASRKTQIQAT